MKGQETLHNRRKNSAFYISVLGCSKNQVDGEGIVCLLLENGFNRVSAPEEADFIIILSCGFVDQAKEEAINAVFEAVLLKKKKKLKVILAGCLVQRHGKEIADLIPELDGIAGISENHRMHEFLDSLTEKRFVCNPVSEYRFDLNREYDLSKTYTYLKISEGCSNCCSYCTIPLIKGSLRSRPAEDIVREAVRIEKLGFRELIITSQDITAWGTDQKSGLNLVSLLRQIISETDRIMIRLLYLHPARTDKELLMYIGNNQKRIFSYLDLPIQHAHDDILFSMNRGYTSGELKQLFFMVREMIPDVVIRTTVMTGYPGEGRSEFSALMKFLEQNRPERTGVFVFSPQEDTKAFGLKKVGGRTAESRFRRLSDLSAQLSLAYNHKRTGKTYTVTVDETLIDLPFKYQGRSYAEAPEIDPVIFFNSLKNLKPGDQVPVKITNALVYDLEGEC